jgi:hypothetical protein
MSAEKTVIEPEPSGKPATERTILEGVPPGADTFIEQPDAAPGAQGFVNLVPGADFGDYQLVSPIPVNSGEADLWRVERRPDRHKFLLKLYRYGIAPKADILQALHHLRHEHVVDLIDSGERGGRHYEIQEYIEHGSLANVIKNGGLGEEYVRAVVDELASALSHLHAANVLHRDLKPSNILVRTLQPLDLVLADFGISSISTLSLHYTSLNRTEAYAAPETLSNIVSKASDWWSVGILLIELLTGKHPFAGRDVRQINLHLLTQPVTVPPRISTSFQGLIKGLLTRDYQKRWGSAQVTEWLSGSYDIPVFYETPSETQHSHRYKPFKFAGKEYYTLPELAVALATNWGEAAKSFGRGYVTKWVTTDVGEHDVANRLQDIAEDAELKDGDQKLAVAVLALNPQLPFTWKGQVVTRDGFVALDMELALALLDSSVPQWQERLCHDHWLVALHERRQATIDWLKKFAVSPGGEITIDFRQVDYLALCDPQRVVEQALNHRSQFVDATFPPLKALLNKGRPLDGMEAIALLTCDQQVFLTPVQAKRQRVLRELMDSLEIEHVDHDKLDRLLQDDLQVLKRKLAKHRGQFVTSSNQKIAVLLRQKRLTEIQALVLLMSPRTLLLTSEERRAATREEVVSQLGTQAEEIDDEELEDLLSRSPEDVIASAYEYRTQFAAAEPKWLAALLRKKDLTYVEAIALLAAPPHLLWNRNWQTVTNAVVVFGGKSGGLSLFGVVAGIVIGWIPYLVLWFIVGVLTWNSARGAAVGEIVYWSCIIGLAMFGCIAAIVNESERIDSGRSLLRSYGLPVIAVPMLALAVLLVWVLRPIVATPSKSATEAPNSSKEAKAETIPAIAAKRLDITQAASEGPVACWEQPFASLWTLPRRLLVGPRAAKARHRGSQRAFRAVIPPLPRDALLERYRWRGGWVPAGQRLEVRLLRHLVGFNDWVGCRACFRPAADAGSDGLLGG